MTEANQAISEALLKSISTGRWQNRSESVNYTREADAIRKAAKRMGVTAEVQRTVTGIKFRASRPASMVTTLDHPLEAEIAPAEDEGYAQTFTTWRTGPTSPKDVVVPEAPPLVTYTVEEQAECDSVSWDDGYRHGYAQACQDGAL